MKKAKKLNIKSLVLKSGAHSSVKEGLCVMEAVAYFAGEKHSDRPECACPVLTKFMINTNDRMNADERALLKPYIKKLIGTRDGKSQKRAELLARAAVAEITPYALRLTKIDCLIAHAEKLEKFKDGTGTFTDMSKACKEAKSDANAYANAAANAAYAADAAADSVAYANAYANAANAYANAAADSVAYANAYANAANAAANAAADSVAYANAYAANAAANAAYAIADKQKARNKVWKMMLSVLDRALKV
jgi:hypothetical protein